MWKTTHEHADKEEAFAETDTGADNETVETNNVEVAAEVLEDVGEEAETDNDNQGNEEALETEETDGNEVETDETDGNNDETEETIGNEEETTENDDETEEKGKGAK